MQVPRNAWYVIAQPKDVTRELKRRVVLSEPVLLYRLEAGEVAAIQDRCPHRFAPLSRGTLFGDVIQCKYHGLRFDSSGQCVLNPHGPVIAPNNRVRRYPIAERHELVWIWMGDPALADPDRIPDLGFMSATGVRTVFNYMQADYRHDVLVDNLLDLSHTDYLHAGTFMGGESDQTSETRVQQEGNDVVTVLTQSNAPVPPGYANVGGVWRFGRPGTHSQAERVDISFRIHWQPGNIINFEKSVAAPHGDLAGAPKLRFTHIVTPETDSSVHYFISMTRDFGIDDPQVGEKLAAFQVGTVQREDGPMLAAVTAEMHGRDLMEMHPVILPTDTGALRVRRVINHLVNEESARREPS